MMEGRNKLHMTGVKEVYNFNENEGIVETSKGTIFIKGKNMHLEKLSLEMNELAMTGNIDSIMYKNSYKHGGDSIWKKIFG